MKTILFKPLAYESQLWTNLHEDCQKPKTGRWMREYRFTTGVIQSRDQQEHVQYNEKLFELNKHIHNFST